MHRTAVVTGVSTGIGSAIATALVKAGFHVFGSVRKPEDAIRVSATLGANFTPLVFDICDEQGVAAAAATVRKALAGKRLSALINNAGIALGGPLLHQPIPEVRRQLEVNVTGQIIVTQAFAPLLGSDPGLAGPPRAASS